MAPNLERARAAAEHAARGARACDRAGIAERVAGAAPLSGRRFPSGHGAPAALRGADDLHRRDCGRALEILPGAALTFSADGAAPQAVVIAPGVPFAVTHAPEPPFTTDVPDRHHPG